MSDELKKKFLGLEGILKTKNEIAQRQSIT